MLAGISITELLQQRPLPVDEIRALLQARQVQLHTLTSVSGSFKTVYALSPEIGVASVKASNKEMLSKETRLLSTLAEHGLPAIRHYTDVFELEGDHQAVLLEWVPDSTLIDVKDSEAAQNKLMSVALGIDIPLGEGWVLHKRVLDAQITALFLENTDTYLRVNHFAKTLHKALLDILENLETNSLRIADLQLLVTKTGTVSIIDPIDVVKVQPRSSNINHYISLLDDSLQNNPDFVTQLTMGHKMLENCLKWCSEVARITSSEDMLKYMLTPPGMPGKEQKKDIHRSLLTRAITGQAYRQSPRPINILPSPAPSPRSIVIEKSKYAPSVASSSSFSMQVAPPPVFLAGSPPKRKAQDPSLPLRDVTKTSPTKREKLSPPTSPVKQSDQGTENCSLPDSPSKVIAFQFQQVRLSDAGAAAASTSTSTRKPAVNRRLSFTFTAPAVPVSLFDDGVDDAIAEVVGAVPVQTSLKL